MVIELIDGTRIENVIGVYGGIKLIDGISRDTLRIETKFVNEKYLSDLTKLFTDNPNTMKLYTYETIMDENHNRSYKKIVMGEGYTIFVSSKTINKTLPHEPGKLLPDTTIPIHEIMIAQMTYEEYQNSIGGE